MINIEGTNKLHDLYRLMRLLLTYLVFLLLGFLLAYYYLDVKEPISYTNNYNFTCSDGLVPPVIIPTSGV